MSFLLVNKSYIIMDPGSCQVFFCLTLANYGQMMMIAWRLLLNACSLLFIFVRRFKIIYNVVPGYLSPEPLYRAAFQPVMKLVAHW